ncbi:MAG: dihydroorotate dehydrogenase-like protein [Candidatus Neomarinimicrobiota bacterium]|nr:MAG: dihydroorotate dehydrogenase-like protein [Candidatus Neomarinimicrobiota bacterium]
MKLNTRYLGFELDTPLVPSASPFTRDIDQVKRLEDAGAPLIVMHSLFEEEILHEDAELEHHLSHGSESYSESLSYFPDHPEFKQSCDLYLEQLRAIKETVSVPVVASLNGVTTGGWVEKASLLEANGADALELNIYHVPTDPAVSSTAVEDLYVDILRAIKGRVSIPVAVKLGPFFSALPSFAARLEREGADGLVLFNRFYQPDIDLETLEVIPGLNLSTSAEVRLPLRWIAVLSPICKKVSFAASSGIHTAEDVLKVIMAGADVAMMTSALLKFGPEHLAKVRQQMVEWMEEFEYESISQMKGSMCLETVLDPKAFVRSNYMKMLNDYVYKPGS